MINENVGTVRRTVRVVVCECVSYDSNPVRSPIEPHIRSAAYNEIEFSIKPTFRAIITSYLSMIIGSSILCE